MPWVMFIKPHDYVVREKYIIAYKAGGQYLVKQVCAEDAIKKGKAVLIERPEHVRRRSKI